MEDFPFEHFLKPEKQEEITPIADSSKNKAKNDSETLLIQNEFHKALKEYMSKEKYDAFFKNSFFLESMDGENLYFTVSTQFLKKLVNEYYIDALRTISSKLFGSSYKVNLRLVGEHSPDSEKKAEQVENNEEKKEYSIKKGKTVRDTSFSIDEFKPNNQEMMNSAQSKLITHLENKNSGLAIDKRKTFSSFIVGPSNNLAHASAIAVAKNPGQIYSSLYLYGNSGLGKTHLLHSVANYICDKSPQLRIFITTANEFMSEMIKSIQAQDIQSFRKKYSEMVDILMIDDIHELKNRPGTQNEFFHVFNELERRKKQLIFTSDKEPKEINGIEDRIKTRLSSALVVEIQQPDLETRIAILKKKAIEEDIYLPDDVVNLIASCIKNNIRELEGSLIKLGAYSSVFNVDIDLEIAKEQLKISSDDLVKTVNMETITKSISNYFKIPVPDIRSKARNKEITFARHIAMYFSYYLGKSTLIEIGDYFGKRDHTSVMHGINKIKQLQKTDHNLTQLLYEIEGII